MSKPLSWVEIQKRAIAFVKEFEHATSEASLKQIFWHEFFGIFGIRSNRVGSFEVQAKRHSTKGQGWIDYLWPGIVAIEHKSAGKPLDDAEKQNLDYLDSLGETDVPQLLVACDFKRFRITDFLTAETVEFDLADLPDNLHRFGPIAGHRQRDLTEQEDASVKAAELLADVYTHLESQGYTGHNLALFSVRLLFCLFADDSGIWQHGLLQQMIESRTHEDGSDLGTFLNNVFEVLDTPEDKRQGNLDEELAALPYINGGLFAEHTRTPVFDGKGRKELLKASNFNWSKVSPAIFGSIFQSVKDPEARRELGSHYTTEANILRLIRPLFLDDLNAQFQAAHNSVPRLEALRKSLADLTFLDPAMGCGNFLIITYRELRRLELRILTRLRELNQSSGASPTSVGGTKARKGSGKAGAGQLGFDATLESLVNVGQFYGIEIDEFPARIAQTAMYLVDHIENMHLSAEFGDYYARFPISDEAHIHVENACRIDWNTVIPAADLDYIIGNPPFLGRQYRNADQVEDMRIAHDGAKGHGPLDYVTAWYGKAADFMTGNKAIRAGLVSTNSITQGESVGLLWPRLLGRGVHIDYGVRSFKWGNDAKNKAKVTVVIIGFSLGGRPPNLAIYEEEKDPTTGAIVLTRTVATNINPYLVDAPDIVVGAMDYMLVPGYPSAVYGSMANDGGGLIIKQADYANFMADPVASKYVREYVGADEVFKGVPRHCLWLDNAPAADLANPLIAARLRAVMTYRKSKTRTATAAAAATPSLFVEIRPQNEDYIFMPFVSSEKREYIPSVIKTKDDICAAPHWRIPGTDMFVFGIILSRMFLGWAESVAGQLETRIRLSPGTAYNTFPFPDLATVTQAQRDAVEKGAQSVLDARAQHSASLKLLYDPTTMPPNLRRAHQGLDKAVDALFSKKKGLTDLDRQTLLFNRFDQLRTANQLLPVSAKRPPKKSP